MTTVAVWLVDGVKTTTFQSLRMNLFTVSLKPVAEMKFAISWNPDSAVISALYVCGRSMSVNLV